MTIKSSRTWFPAELPTVPRRAGARAVSLVALAVDTLAVPFAPRAPKPLPALAAARELVARRVVTVALDATVPPHPAGGAQAASGHGVARGVDAAVAVVVALGTPDAGVTRAFSGLLVAFALLTQTRILAVRSPAVVIAGALAGQVITLAIGVTITFSLAVGAPELGRALCDGTDEELVKFLSQELETEALTETERGCSYTLMSL